MSRYKIFYKLVKKQNLPLILFFFLSIIIALSLSTKSCLLDRIWCGQDMDQYLDYSDNLLSGHGFSAQKVSSMYFIDPAKEHIYIPEILRLPGYPLILSMGRIFYNKPLLALFYNFFFYAMILIYSLKLIKFFLSPPFWLLAFSLIALNSTFVFYTTQMGNADVFAGFAIIGFTFHFLSLLKGKNVKINLVLCSALGILSILSRQNTSIFILPLIGIFILTLIRQGKKTQIKYLITLFLIILLPMVIWIFRNFTLTHKPLISAASGMQLFSEHIQFSPYQNKTTAEITTWVTAGGGKNYISSFRKEGHTVPEAYALFDEYVRKITWGYIINNPSNTINQFALEVRSIYVEPSYSWEKKDILFFLKKIDTYVSSIYLYLMLLFPLIYFKNKNLMPVYVWAPLSLFIYVSAFFHGIIIGSRGLLPVLPLVIIFSVLFIEVFILKCLEFKK